MNISTGDINTIKLFNKNAYGKGYLMLKQTTDRQTVRFLTKLQKITLN